MSGRFVRASKFRHVFGQSSKKEQCYDNLRITKNAWDTNLIKANPKYIAVNWEAGGGGAFAVIPVDERGKLPEKLPLFRGHTAAVLDTDWSPFDDSLIVSGSDDGKVGIYRVPEGFALRTDAEEPEDVMPLARLSGHTRKVGHVLFNPSAANVLASSSGDYTVKIWDVEQRASKLNLKHNDIVQSLSWSADGNMLVTTSRDKKLRWWDVRQEKAVHEVPGHSGAKNSRVVWMGEHDRVATTGFSRMSDRQLGLWDVRNPKEPIGGFTILDSISGVCMPFWDDGCQMLYLAGKGDGNIRYYEYEHDKFEYLSEYKSADPQRGVAFLPKRGINTHENEIMRAYKTVNETYIEPISFVVPRRAEVFQTDIYPPTTGLRPAMSSQDYFAGKSGMPPKISLESLYDGQEPQEVPGSDPLLQSASASRAEPTRAPIPHSFQDSKLSMPNTGSDVSGVSQTKDATPSSGNTSSGADPLLQSASTSSRNESNEAPAPPPHTFQDSKLSMPNTGSDVPGASQTKNAPASSGTTFSTTDPLLQSASTSSRNESTEARTPAPHSFKDSKTSMANMASKYADKDGEEDGTDSSSFEEISRPAERPHAALVNRQEEKTGVKTPSQVDSKPSFSTNRSVDEQDSSAAAAPSSPAGGAKGAAEGIRGVLQDMKAMIASQGKQMAEQSEKIEILAREVASMKARLGD